MLNLNGEELQHPMLERARAPETCTGKRALADMLLRPNAIYRRDLDEDTFNLYRIRDDVLESLAGGALSDTWEPCNLMLEHFLQDDDWVKVK